MTSASDLNDNLSSMLDIANLRVKAKFTKAMLRQSKYTEGTMCMMARIEDCSKELTEQATSCSYRRQGEISDLIKESMRYVDKGFRTRKC